MEYDLGTEQVTQKFNVNDLFSLVTNVDCGVISLEFTDENGMPLSDEIFSIEDNLESDGQLFVVQEQKLTETVGLHLITYKSLLNDYPNAKANGYF